MNKFILMWLEAPLQSWGFDSKFWKRDTLSFPTKSGIMGMFCSASGSLGSQEDLLSIMAPMKQSVISFIKNERTINLEDFHIIGSGYNGDDSWEKLMTPKTLESKTPVGGGSKITYRTYLQNATFAVVVETPCELAEKFSNSLMIPSYPIFLGRKNCVPTDIIYRGMFDKESDALEEAIKIAKEKELKIDFKVFDGEDEDGSILALNDIPISFGINKKYKERLVSVIEDV